MTNDEAVQILATEGRKRGWFVNCAADGQWGVVILQRVPFSGLKTFAMDTICIGAGDTFAAAVADAWSDLQPVQSL